MKDTLREAAKQLLHLHLCEQEGLSSGQPTREQWLKAVDDLSAALASEGDGWIRVEDGLPDDSEDREVWEKGSRIPTIAHYLSRHYFMDNYNDSNYMEEGWYYSHGYSFDAPEIPLTVTHYRKLPTPPKTNKS